MKHLLFSSGNTIEVNTVTTPYDNSFNCQYTHILHLLMSYCSFQYYNQTLFFYWHDFPFFSLNMKISEQDLWLELYRKPSCRLSYINKNVMYHRVNTSFVIFRLDRRSLFTMTYLSHSFNAEHCSSFISVTEEYIVS